MLIILAALGMSIMVSAGDLISLYIGIELHSLALYILAAFRRDDAKSSEAGLKYFVLGALSSGLLLYGASLVYGFAGAVTLRRHRRGDPWRAPASASSFGLVFLICGIAFKVSAAPFHMWTPDVYEGAPTPIVGFFAGAPKLAAMALFARLLTEAFPGADRPVAPGGDDRRRCCRCSSAPSPAWRRATSSGCGPTRRSPTSATPWSASPPAATAGVQSMLMFMVLYTIDVTGFFACLAALQRDGRPMEPFDDFAGLMRERPGLALAMTAFSLSALGMPPFSGFWAKFYVFKAALAAGR